MCCHSSKKDTTTDRATDTGGSGCTAVSMCSIKANRTGHSGSVGKKEGACQRIIFCSAAHLPASATLRAVYSVCRHPRPHQKSCSFLLFGPLIGGRTPHPCCCHTLTHTCSLWVTASACSLKIDVEKKGLNSSRAPFFCCIRIRGPARICCNWLRRHFVDGGGVAEWLSCSNVASFYFFLSVSFGIHLSAQQLT